MNICKQFVSYFMAINNLNPNLFTIPLCSESMIIDPFSILFYCPFPPAHAAPCSSVLSHQQKQQKQQHRESRLRSIDVWKVYKNRMWSTITSPTNSTKKLIVVQKHAKLGEPQLITVDSNCSNETKNIGNGGRVEEAQFRQGGLRRFRNTRRAAAATGAANNCWEMPVQENHHRGYQVTTTLSSKGNSGPAKVVLTSQRSGDNKAPVTPA